MKVQKRESYQYRNSGLFLLHHATIIINSMITAVVFESRAGGQLLVCFALYCFLPYFVFVFAFCISDIIDNQFKAGQRGQLS